MKHIPASEIIGKRYGRLVALAEAPRTGANRRFLFRCDCGTEKAIALSPVRTGATCSCGCLANELSRMRKARRSHGECHKTPEHRSWQAMLTRCLNPKHVAYSRYGGRGIGVCPQWQGDAGYATFLRDMGRRPSLAFTLDRIDNDRGYEPDNCRWASKGSQLRNRRTARLIEYRGEQMNLCDAASRFGLSRALLRWRLGAGWPVERALETPAR